MAGLIQGKEKPRPFANGTSP